MSDVEGNYLTSRNFSVKRCSVMASSKEYLDFVLEQLI